VGEQGEARQGVMVQVTGVWGVRGVQLAGWLACGWTAQGSARMKGEQTSGSS
jgi:hypothetical protein